MRDIELPGTPQYLCPGIEKSFGSKPLPIDDGGGKSRNKNENLGGIKKLRRLQGKIAQYIFWDVIDENENQGDSAKEIEPDIALVGRFGHAR
jgi:hypothetical protein